MRLQKLSHFYAELQSSPIQVVRHPHCAARNIQFDIKRDDLIHPIVSGNKWRKLKHLLLHIESLGYQKIACMGGGAFQLGSCAGLFDFQVELEVAIVY